MDPKCSTSNNFETAILNLLYETQFFEFHPRMFSDRVYNAFFEAFQTSVLQMKQYMIKEFENVSSSTVINAQTEVFFQYLVKKLDKSIDRLEVYLNDHVFTVENHVVFSEDKIHIEQPHTKEEEEKLDAEIEDLRKKILEEKARRFFLKNTMSEQEELKKKLSSLLNKIKALLKSANEMDFTPENINLLFSNINKLKEFNIHE